MAYRKILMGTATAAFLLSSSAALAGDPAFGSNSLSAKPSANMTNMTMTVTGPNGYYNQQYSSLQAPTMSLLKNGAMADGLYTWELTGATSKLVEANPLGLNDGRGASARKFVNESVLETGTFRVVNGSIVGLDGAVEEDRPIELEPKLPLFGQ